MHGSIRSNWSILLKSLRDIDDKLQDPKNYIDLENHIYKAQKAVEITSELIQQQNLYIIGSINLNKELTFIHNKLKGISYGLETGELKNKQSLKILKDTRQGLETVLDEVSIKLDKQVLNKIIANNKAGNIDNISTEKYSNLTDAMQAVVKKFGNLNNVSDIDKNASKDIINMSRVMEKNTTDLSKMKAAINKNKTDPNETENFVYLHGPVLTAAKFDINKLNAAGIDYDTVYFPGVRYNFSRKEETPRYYILRDQILIAVIVGNKKSFKLKLNNMPLSKKIALEDKQFNTMLSDIIHILSEKLHYDLVHVGANENNFITNKNFPGIRFVWLIKKELYNKIGPFSPNTLGLPF